MMRLMATATDFAATARTNAERLLNQLLRRAVTLLAVGLIGALGSALLATQVSLSGRSASRLLATPFIFLFIAGWGGLALRAWARARSALRERGEEATISISQAGARGRANPNEVKLRRLVGVHRVGLEFDFGPEIGAAALARAWDWPVGFQTHHSRCLVFGTVRPGAVILAVCEHGAVAGTVRSSWRREPLPSET